MISVHDIIATPSLADIVVLAGKNGLDREVLSVTVLDAPDGPKWLKGGELILSSAYLFENNNVLLMDYISELIEVGASGLGIKIGRFVNSISKEVADFADAHAFPILKIPYKLVWTDIISPFYKLRYGLEQPQPPIRMDPEIIGTIVEASRWGTRRLVERLTELYRLPLSLIKHAEIIEDNGIAGVEQIAAIMKWPTFFPENAVGELYEEGGFWISFYQVPLKYAGKTEYIAVGTQNKDTIAQVTRLFELLAVLMNQQDIAPWDETQHYRRFLMRVVSGELTEEEVRSFEKNRALEGHIYSAIMLLSGPAYQKVYEQVVDVVKHMGAGNSAPLPIHMLYNQSAKEAVVLLEYRSVVPQPNITSWLRGVLVELDEQLISAGGGWLAVSNMHETLMEISVCYREARDAARVGRLLWDKQSKYSYTSVSAYIMLEHADLEKADLTDISLLMQNHSLLSFDGVETMEAYIECNSYKAAAKKLYIHENTLRYRIQKINELMNLNLENPLVSHSILMKIKLWRLLNASKSVEADKPIG